MVKIQWNSQCKCGKLAFKCDLPKFIDTESDEELDEVADRNPEVKKAVIKYRELTAEERTRDTFERLEKARRDQAMHQKWAIKKSQLEIARRLLGTGDSIDKIITVTDLTREEVEGLCN